MNEKVKKIVEFSILLAIEAIFCFTPLGSLPAIGPIVATLGMIPVIITSLLLGFGYGAMMGFFAGLFSLIVWSFMPPSPLVAFVFSPLYSLGTYQGNFGSILISFVPRILTGLFPYLIYRGLVKIWPKGDRWCLAIAAFLSSLENTIGVLGLIWIFFGKEYSSLAGKSMLALIGLTVLTSGLPEALISSIVSPLIVRGTRAALTKNINKEDK